MKLSRLTDIIKLAQKRHPRFAKRFEEAEALGRWRLAVGEVIARHSRAIRVKDSVLWVEVEHPIWRSELHYRKKQILAILNGQSPSGFRNLTPPQEILKDIRYTDPRGGPSL